MAMLEMIGVVSIMPFMAVLMNPDLIDTNNLLNAFFNASNIFDIETKEQFLFFLGIIVFLILVVSLTFKFLTFYIQLRFTSTLNYSLAKRLVEGYLHQPYSWFLNRHSADLGKTILSEVSVVVSQGLNPMLNLIRQSVVAFVLIIMLIFVDTKLTLIVGFTLGAAYGLIYAFIRGYVARIGYKRLNANKWMFTSISEAFGATKEIKVGGLEQAYINRFSKPAKTLAKITASAGVISHLPRFALEAITFGGMLLVVLYLMVQSGTFTNAVPVIALYAFAGYRLMPALQQIYTSLTTLRFVGPALDAMHKDIKNLKQLSSSKQKHDAMSLKNDITLKNVYYNYPNSSRTALKDVYMNIPTHNTVGIVGATGSGKTTTVDIILGLLEPEQGTLEVDGNVINKQNLRSWQSAIGYVPQNIFLADDTVAANIAFGIEPAEVNHEDIERSAKIAKLHEFVINELPQKYQTTIGERGIRLSGGQRQRIGIARALYHSPKVLILDEATSSLDNLTEKAVMEAVQNIGKEITIIMIAHRLSTVKECDTIFLLEKGKIKQQGTFKELVKNSDFFQAENYRN